MTCVHFSTTFFAFVKSGNAYKRVVTAFVIKVLIVEIDN